MIMLNSRELDTAITCFNTVSGYLLGVVSSLPEDEWCTSEELVMNSLNLLGEFLQNLEINEE